MLLRTCTQTTRYAVLTNKSVFRSVRNRVVQTKSEIVYPRHDTNSIGRKRNKDDMNSVFAHTIFLATKSTHKLFVTNNQLSVSSPDGLFDWSHVIASRNVTCCCQELPPTILSSWHVSGWHTFQFHFIWNSDFLLRLARKRTMHVKSTNWEPQVINVRDQCNVFHSA